MENESGYVAQGHAVAQSAINLIKSQVRDWTRIVHSLFPLEVKARQVAHKELTQFRNQCVKNAEATLAHVDGVPTGTWRKMANSATTRLSQLQTIIRAMNIGLSMETLKDSFGVQDPENITFDAIIPHARMLLQSEAKSGAGRKPDAWEVKLRKWLDKNQPTEKEPQAVEKFVKIRTEILV